VSHLLHTQWPSHWRTFLDKIGNVQGEVFYRLIYLNIVLPDLSLTSSGQEVTMKSVVHHVMWFSTCLVLAIAFSLGTVHAQEQGRGDQPTKPSDQAGEVTGQERMGERGQMT
jgi:hypothetical protein